MFNDEVVYEADYKDKFELFKELVKSKLGPATEQGNLRQKLPRIQLKGQASNNISLLSDAHQDMPNAVVVSVREDAIVNQVYIDQNNVELILSDGGLQQEFFEKLNGISSTVYTVQEKQVDYPGLLFRFVR